MIQLEMFQFQVPQFRNISVLLPEYEEPNAVPKAPGLPQSEDVTNAPGGGPNVAVIVIPVIVFLVLLFLTLSFTRLIRRRKAAKGKCH